METSRTCTKLTSLFVDNELDEVVKNIKVIGTRTKTTLVLIIIKIIYDRFWIEYTYEKKEVLKKFRTKRRGFYLCDIHFVVRQVHSINHFNLKKVKDVPIL